MALYRDLRGSCRVAEQAHAMRGQTSQHVPGEAADRGAVEITKQLVLRITTAAEVSLARSDQSEAGQKQSNWEPRGGYRNLVR